MVVAEQEPGREDRPHLAGSTRRGASRVADRERERRGVEQQLRVAVSDREDDDGWEGGEQADPGRPAHRRRHQEQETRRDGEGAFHQQHFGTQPFAPDHLGCRRRGRHQRDAAFHEVANREQAVQHLLRLRQVNEVIVAVLFERQISPREHGRRQPDRHGPHLDAGTPACAVHGHLLERGGKPAGRRGGQSVTQPSDADFTSRTSAPVIAGSESAHRTRSSSSIDGMAH